MGNLFISNWGKYRELERKCLVQLWVKRDVSRALVVENRAALPFEQGHRLEVFIDDSPTRWGVATLSAER